MEPINQKRMSTTDIVYEKLKNAIITRELLPGERIKESSLTDKLQVSRTPLRGALKLLEYEGFITRNISGRIHVSNLSIKEFKDIYELERVLEAKAIKDVTQNWQGDDLDKLDEIIQKIKAGYNKEKNNLDKSMTEKDLKKYNMLNVEFHKTIIDLHGNIEFLNNFNNIEDKHLRYAHISFSNDKERFLNASQEHIKIHNLIKERKSEEVVEVAHKHKKNAEKEILKKLKEYINKN